jgi:hypothetical protein
VYLFLPAARWEQLEARMPAGCRVLGQHRDLYQHRDIVVVTNR